MTSEQDAQTVTILCPFHDQLQPSMIVHQGYGSYYCHDCKASGTLLSLMEEIRERSRLVRW